LLLQKETLQGIQIDSSFGLNLFRSVFKSLGQHIKGTFLCSDLKCSNQSFTLLHIHHLPQTHHLKYLQVCYLLDFELQTSYLIPCQESFIKQKSSQILTLKSQDGLAEFIFSFMSLFHSSFLKTDHQKFFKEILHERKRQGLQFHPDQYLR